MQQHEADVKAAQKKIDSATTILTLRLTRAMGESRKHDYATFLWWQPCRLLALVLSQATRLPLQLVYTAIGALIDGCGS